MNELVTTNWLYQNLNNEKLVIFDSSWHLPKEKIDPKKIYLSMHINKAHFFDIEKISLKNSKLPHMVPDLNFFKKKMLKYGINNDSKIIIYGYRNIMGPSRAWWMFKYFGFNNVSVLNGGLNKWLKEKKPINNIKEKVKKKSYFDFKIDRNWITDKGNINKNLYNKKYLIIDARNRNRYLGLEKESREGLRSGHIINSKNLFWKNLTNKDTMIVSKKKIQIQFDELNLKNKYITVTCGSGISACVLSLSMKHALGIKSKVYDGSWAEWGYYKTKKI